MQKLREKKKQNKTSKSLLIGGAGVQPGVDDEVAAFGYYLRLP